MSIKNILHRLNSRDIRLIPNFSKKAKFAFILIAFIFLGFITHQIIAADMSEAVDKYKTKQEALHEGNNQEAWMNESIGSNAMSINNMLVGDIDFNEDGTLKTGWVPKGAIGLANQGIAYLYNPPFSGVQYIAQVVNNFLGKPAYAATGYEGLQSLIPLWRGFRNVTYILFSIIFIGIGIAIMLRIKISQNAVITIQSAIPKLITSLILVTFSYAIVGLLIDLSYVIEALALSIISSASGSSLNISETISNPNIFGRAFSLISTGAITTAASTSLLGIVGTIMGALISNAVGWAILAITGILLIIIILVVLIVLLVTIFKFFFGLMKCYINILLRIVLGPLEIALGAIPNMKMGFNTWILNIVANLAVFPITLIFIVLIKVIMEAINKGNNIWTPSGLGFLSGGGLLSLAIGIGGLALISKLPKLIPELIFQIKPSGWGKAIGESFAPINRIASGGVKYGISSAGKSIGKLGYEADGETERAGRRARVQRGLGRITDYFTGKH